MKVWIIVEQYYDEVHLCDVFSSEEEAKEQIFKLQGERKNWGPWYYIEEMDVK
jgi:hypothetical protein